MMSHQLDERLCESSTWLFEQANFHVDPGLFQLLDPPYGHFRVRVDHADVAFFQTCFDDGVGARWRLAVVTAGLKSDKKRAATRFFASLFKSENLSVRSA